MKNLLALLILSLPACAGDTPLDRITPLANKDRVKMSSSLEFESTSVGTVSGNKVVLYNDNGTMKFKTSGGTVTIGSGGASTGTSTSILAGNGSGGFFDVTIDASLSYSGGTLAIATGGVTNAMLAGSIAASKLIGTDITTVGTITAGTWQGNAIASTYLTGDDTAYDATSWNGSTGVPTKNAIRDKIESLGSGSGDMLKSTYDPMNAGYVSGTPSAPNFGGQLRMDASTGGDGGSIYTYAGTDAQGGSIFTYGGGISGSGSGGPGGQINTTGSGYAGGSILTYGLDYARGGDIWMFAGFNGLDNGGEGGSLYTYGGVSSAATGGLIDTHGADAAGGKVETYGGTLAGGSIATYDGGGSINTRGTGSIQLGASGTRTTLTGTATANRSISTPDASGTLAISSTSANFDCAQLVIGNADTSLGRLSAGQLSLSGVQVVTLSNTMTLTNKTISGANNTLSNIANASLSNSSITIAGTSVSLGGSISLDAITGLGSNGIVKRTGANTCGIATPGTDYLTTPRKSISVFGPMQSQPPASNYATLSSRNSIAVLEFDDTTEESTVFVGVIPDDAVLTSGLTVNIKWMTAATSGNGRWGVQFERMHTDADTDDFDTAAEAHTACSGTSGIMVTTSITNTNIDGLTAGDAFRLKVYRDASDTTNDTITGDLQLVVVEVKTAN